MRRATETRGPDHAPARVRTVAPATVLAAGRARARGGRWAPVAERRLPEVHRLTAADGVRIHAVLDPRSPAPGGAAAGSDEVAFVVAHGFTGSWRRPAVRTVVQRLAAHADVVSFDFRGHGGSGGASTVGDREVLDLDAAVAWARSLGHRTVVTVGWSMGASVVLRHAALQSRSGGARPLHPIAGHAVATPVDAVVAVSGPGRWWFRGTPPMRRVHLAVETHAGRAVARWWLRTRIAEEGWDPVPESPTQAAARIAPTPLLVVHGDADPYFPVAHAEAVHAAAREPKELWIEPGFGHAEGAAGPELVDRIARWALARAGAAGGPDAGAGR
ncbi:MAG: alpha/beta hydrolase [Motilibacteraceae bacterium]